MERSISSLVSMKTHLGRQMLTWRISYHNILFVPHTMSRFLVTQINLNRSSYLRHEVEARLLKD